MLWAHCWGTRSRLRWTPAPSASSCHWEWTSTTQRAAGAMATFSLLLASSRSTCSVSWRVRGRDLASAFSGYQGEEGSRKIDCPLSQPFEPQYQLVTRVQRQLMDMTLFSPGLLMAKLDLTGPACFDRSKQFTS